MKDMIKNYVQEETAADEVTHIVLAVLGLVIVVAIGWYIWNLISSWSKNGQEVSDNASHKQTDPFGAGTRPFGN